ncbi:MAG: signal peptidase I [Blautia wexlerae]
MNKLIVKKILYAVKNTLIAFLLALFVVTCIIINAVIPSESMEKTIMTGDRLIGNRLAYGINLQIGDKQICKKLRDPKRFDIVIFRYPDDESELYIKRIIGLPGETVEIKDGDVYIDGSKKPLDDSFTAEKTEDSFGPYTVPKDSYFVMGDNRNCSYDSRFWDNTYVRFDEILGKAVFRYYPGFKLIK